MTLTKSLVSARSLSALGVAAVLLINTTFSVSGRGETRLQEKPPGTSPAKRDRIKTNRLELAAEGSPGVLFGKGNQPWTDPATRIIQQSQKHHTSIEKRLGMYLAKLSYKDPVLPSLMHGLKRYLAGAQNPNKLDQLIQSNLTKNNVARPTIEKLVKGWDSVSPAFKAQWFPPAFLNLDIKQPVNLNLLADSVIKAVGTLKIPLSRIPVDPKLPGTAPGPRITSVRIAGLDSALVLRPGAEFTLFGRNFSSVPAQNRVQIGRERMGAGSVEFDVLHEVTPTFASTTELRATAPAALTPGTYSVRVLTNRIFSNNWNAYVETPPAPAPRFDSLEPAGQYPGKIVILHGENFSRDSVATFESLSPGGPFYIRAGSPTITFRNTTELRLLIPQEVWPGGYEISISNPFSSRSTSHALSVLAPHYRVQLEEIRCVDESDAESPDDDEVFGVFEGQTAGFHPARAMTPEYENFSDGVVLDLRGGPFNMFSNGGAAVPVSDLLSLVSTLFESDAYDPILAGLIASAAGAAASAVTAGILIALEASTLVTGLVTAGVGLIIGAVVLAVLLLEPTDDFLGVAADLYTAVDLQTRTAASGASYDFTRHIQFRNDDDTGSYDFIYRVIRSEP